MTKKTYITKLKALDKRYQRIVKSSSLGVLAKISSAVVNLLLVPLLLDYLGTERFALWAIVGSLILWLQLTDFGLGAGLINQLSKSYGNGDLIAASSYIYITTKVLTWISILFTPIFLSVTLLIPWGTIYNIGSIDLTNELRNCIIISGVVFLISSPLSTIQKLYISFQLSYIASTFQILSSAIILLSVSLLIKIQAPIEVLIIFLSSTPLLTSILLWIHFISSKSAPLKIVKTNHNIEQIKSIASLSIPLFLLQISSLFVNEVVIILIANIGSLSDVTNFNIIQKIYILGFIMASAFTYPFYPAIREAYEKNEIFWMKNAIKNIFIIRITIVILYSTVLFVFGNQILNIWLGEATMRNPSLTHWAILTSCMILVTLSSILGEILSILDYLWRQIIYVVQTSIVVIFGSYIYFSEYGIYSIYMATSIATLAPIMGYFVTLKNIIKLKES